MSIIKPILARFPVIEVAVRLAYWRVPVLRALGDRIRSAIAARRRAAPPAEPVDFEDVLACLRALGVGAGDILIVHSSYNALKPTGLSPAAIVERLLALVGPEGTLAMPAIPIIRHEPKGADKFSDAAYDRLFDYDADSLRIATGALPRTLMQAPGAARSLHPGNSMVAVGAQAEAMMRDNLSGDEPAACGPGSSWHYAYDHDAKIVALGVDMVHSLTMIHVAEDAFDWPVAGWYRRRRFRISGKGVDREIAIRERKHSWSQYYAEHAFARDLRRAGVMRTRMVGGIGISYCASRRLIQFLRDHPRVGYPYRFPLGVPRY
ncbi:MAG TPA: AAC(3) family N-acetyltransferase [Sphingomonas sp.]|nr:AAC(3) family N-acetyltransferase [Sphingomonas sp.]